jgi:hypothetical protein
MDQGIGEEKAVDTASAYTEPNHALVGIQVTLT